MLYRVKHWGFGVQALGFVFLGLPDYEGLVNGCSCGTGSVHFDKPAAQRPNIVVLTWAKYQIDNWPFHGTRTAEERAVQAIASTRFAFAALRDCSPSTSSRSSRASSVTAPPQRQGLLNDAEKLDPSVG